VEVINDDGCNLGDRYPETFDKVLLDTPCSGEGRFLLNESSTYSKWSTKMVDELSALQVKLITSACKALKPGGTLVYSTCTLNKNENEKIVDYAIKNLNMEVVPIDLKIKNKINGDAKGFDKQVKDTIKIIPNKNFEGFYVAKLIKK
jgi:16S rRNA (cytosine1407-C5)-methyltransferase